jgi:hypothetical protein
LRSSLAEVSPSVSVEACQTLRSTVVFAVSSKRLKLCV